VADVERAFAEVWAMCGAPLDISKLAKREDFQQTGNTALRVIQNAPSVSHTYRIDQLLAAGVRETMWITDAYFVGTPAYLEGLKDASRDGVDVRILVPQSTDIALIRDTTRTTYRSLLESGVRVFEWNGSMVHSKTAVFDGKFSRIGSTNLNVASWFGNLELDVLIEDEKFGAQMMQMFLRDLENSTEIVLADTQKVLRRRDRKKRVKGKGTGSVRKATAGALNTATSIGAAITKIAPLGAAESRLLFLVGAALVLTAVLLLIFPRVFSIPIAVLLLLPAVTILTKAIRYYRKK
jgi:cardiolipin synthase